jgi:hypothetical protein
VSGARAWGIGVLLAVMASAGAATAAAASPPGTHHVGATLHGPGGARLRIDAQVPRGYHVVLHDPVRMRGAALILEIRQGSGLTRSGVMLISPQGALPYFTTQDPAYPAPPQTARAVARSWEPQSTVKARRVTRDRYLLVRGTHPVGFVVAMHGALPSAVVGHGVGRALLEDLVRTLVARWIAPIPLGASSDPEALALRDRANAAIAGQDAYSLLIDPGHTEDVVRSARYLASFAGADHVLQGLEIGHTRATAARAPPVAAGTRTARSRRGSTSRRGSPSRLPG